MPAWPTSAAEGNARSPHSAPLHTGSNDGSAPQVGRLAVDEVLAELAPHTDALISGNGMAATETVAELSAARDAVLAVSGEGTGAGALPRWLAAAGAVEESHRVANEAAIAAAEAAAVAAERAASERVTAQPPRTLRSPWHLEPGETRIYPDGEMCRLFGFLCGPVPSFPLPLGTPPPVPEPAPYFPY